MTAIVDRLSARNALSYHNNNNNLWIFAPCRWQALSTLGRAWPNRLGPAKKNGPDYAMACDQLHLGMLLETPSQSFDTVAWSPEQRSKNKKISACQCVLLQGIVQLSTHLDHRVEQERRLGCGSVDLRVSRQLILHTLTARSNLLRTWPTLSLPIQDGYRCLGVADRPPCQSLLSGSDAV